MGNGATGRVQSWVYIAVTIVTCLVLIGIAYGSLVGDVEQNTDHRKDENVHMPYQEKVKNFPTREEFNIMQHSLDRILDKLDDIELELRKQ